MRQFENVPFAALDDVVVVSREKVVIIRATEAGEIRGLGSCRYCRGEAERSEAAVGTWWNGQVDN